MKHHCIVFVFIMGVSWGLGHPHPCLPSSLSSVLTCFTVFIKHQLTSLLFFPLFLSFLLKFTALYFFKAWTMPTGRLEGGGIRDRREQLGLLHWRERHCVLDQECLNSLCGNWSMEHFGERVVFTTWPCRPHHFINRLSFCQKLWLKWQTLQRKKYNRLAPLLTTKKKKTKINCLHEV